MSPIAAAPAGYEAPSVSDFWQPLFGTEGAFAITRPALVFLLSAIVLSLVLLVVSLATLLLLRDRWLGRVAP